jgi:hypothetical protein
MILKESQAGAEKWAWKRKKQAVEPFGGHGRYAATPTGELKWV